jgi:hypothetical protein
VAPPIVHEVLHSQGRPLEPGIRADMEARLGHDFSQVRVHDDALAARSAAAVDARAYTVGRDVVLGTTSPPQSLLAHELAHVVQQEAKPPPHGRLEIGRPGDAFEREAEAVATRPTSSVAERAAPSVQRQTGTGGGSTVYMCSKPLDRSPVGTHALFRVGGPGTGRPTYSLQPEKQSVMDLGDPEGRGGWGAGCYQGIPKRDFPGDQNAYARCEATSISVSCLESEFAAYPIGMYCTMGPNSNTFVGHLARRCGLADPDPPGWNPGIDDSPPTAGTYAGSPEFTLVAGCGEKLCGRGL